MTTNYSVFIYFFFFFAKHINMFAFFPANEVVGDKISLGVFSNETDWSQEKIDLKVRNNKCNQLLYIHN